VRSASTNRGTKKARDGGEPVNFWLSRTLADRIDAAAAAIGFTRTELIRRAIETECVATEELSVWRDHEFGRPAIDA